MNLHRRALGRAWPGTFVATKVPKKACSRKASLRAPYAPTHLTAFALQNEQNHGLQLFCPDSPYPQLLQKLAMPPAAAHSPHCSARFHPKLICCEKHPVLIMSS
ncbi:hypothetical protein [Mucilaginibacter kameinonensis]|uniref:hypothetical protein n=1 Tax=Mucilaginibacter kameinonensis TaxID=452286 RepID=UPI0013CF17BF|nr:hypothetical protein [Mucilaginibacter kameinonensis]